MTALISELMLAVGGSFITSLLAKATGVALVALAGTWLMRASRAAVRHVLLAAAFAVLLALPVAALVTPPLRVEVPIAASAGAATAQRASTLETILLLDPVESAAATSTVARVSSSGVSAARVLLTIWGVGATLLLAPVIVGLWQLRSLRRSGLPWRQGQAIVDRMAGELGVARRVDVLLHESVAGPMTCGVIHPAIVLPVDAPTWTDSNLRRALVHELEHVRRLDWMSQCLARVVCAGYWFHPLVWMAWRRLSLEAERACDDAVLRRAEAADYADQLVVLAERLSAASNTPLLAMASRHDLATRVVAVLDGSQQRGRAGFRLVAFACALAGLVVLTMSPLRIVAASPDATVADSGVGQATLNSAAEPRVQPTSKTFEVASIRPCKTEDVIPQQRSGGRGGGAASYSASPGRLNIPCLGVLDIIYLAYAGFGAGPDERLLNNAGSPTNASSIRGGPAWVRSDSEKYAIDAKAEDAADRRQMMGPMLRTLLEERFQLKLHREVEQAPMYALIVARGGLKVQPMKDDECTNDPPRPPGQPPAEKMTCGSLMMAGQMGRRALTFVGTSLSDFARTLSGGMDRYVLDKTGIEGRFILRLEYVQDENTVRMPLGTPIRLDPGPDDPPGVSILTALQEQLGLKLEPTRGPREVLVIDRIERPSSNSGAVAFTSSRGINSR